MTSARKRRFAFGPFERRLFLTIVVGLLPLAVVAFVALFQSAQQQKREYLEASEGTMRAVMWAVDLELAAALASLDALAASPRLARNDFAGFHSEARELLARRPNWLNVVLSGPTAQQVMNTDLPSSSTLPTHIDRPAVEETVRTGLPGINDVLYSPVLETHAFAVRVPITRSGAVEYVLTAVLRTQSIEQILGDQRLTEDGVATVLDTSYNVVARTLSQSEFVGKPASDSLVQLLQQGDETGWAVTTTLEQNPVYTVYYRSPRTGWAAAVGVPTLVLDAPVWYSYAVLGGLIVASVLLGLAAAFLASRAITNPMRELKLAAEALGRGVMPPMPNTDLPEIRQVASALLTAHTQREALLVSERLARAREHDARVAAEDASRTKDEFLAMLGHELRNPLAAVSSASLVLEKSSGRPGSEQTTAHAIAIIRRQTQHLARLTDDLLDAARVVMGRIELDCKPVELADVVQNALDTLRNTHSIEGHTVSVALTPVWVNADATRVDQMVANLLTNALKYTPAPGTIDVRVGREGDEAVLRVRDSGIGVEPDLMPRIFDLFVQGKRALDRSQGGLGIGLTLVRRLTELHGGKVSVSSEGAGTGSEFVIRLPALTIAPVSAPSPTNSSTTARLIVIVEDNEDVRVSLTHVLEMDGHRVLTAGDGRAGLELIFRESPDVALIDIGLPFLDGYAVARAVRGRFGTDVVRLIALTGYGGRDDALAGREAGFDHYLVKPIDPVALRNLIDGAPSSIREWTGG